MPLSFLAPLFLAGLAALAIPVLIHLANRPKKEVVPFPSLMFLERVEYQDASRRRIRNVFLFLLRVLALVLVVSAFARPFVDRPDAVAMAPDGGREVVVLLDRSESMAVGDRMERARDAVREVALGLRRGDRATLVAFDRTAAAVGRATDQAAVLERAAAAIRPGAGGTRYVPALRLGESLLSGAPLPRRELVLISDFQRSGWEPDEAPGMPPGTDVRMVDVGEDLANVFVPDAVFLRERFSGRDRVRVRATIAARGAAVAGSAGADTVEVTAELVLDGRVVESRSVGVAEGGAATVEFDPVTLPDRAVRGTVRAGTDAMPADNALHFVLRSDRSMRVLVARPVRGAAPFLERALAVDPARDIAVVRADRLEAAPLADLDVLVLEGEPSARALDRVGEWVEAGGGLVVVLGGESRGRSWSGRGLLPGTLAGTRDAGPEGAALTGLSGSHPVLDPFRAGAAGLTRARFYRYRELEPAAEATVLARFDGGAPALAVHAVGAGRVAALLSPLDGEWNDLVVQPAFVPLVHRLVAYAAGREPASDWRTVGDLLEPTSLLPDEGGADAAAGARPVLLTPSDRPLPLRADSLYALTERGFYQLRDPRSDREAGVVAVNGDPAESEPARVDPAEVRSVIVGEAPAPPARAAFAGEERERRQSLWWYFLAGAFVLMAAETALSNGISRRPAPRVTREES